MAASVIQTLGEAVSTVTQASISLTLTSATTAGRTLIASCIQAGSSGFTSVTDSKGNTWTKIKETKVSVGGSHTIASFVAYATTALASGDTITLTSSVSTQYPVLVAYEATAISGLADATTSAEDAGTSSTTYSIPGTAIPAGEHLLIGVLGESGAGRSQTPDGTWVRLGASGDAAPTFPRTVMSMWDAKSGGTLSASGTFSGSGRWCGHLLAFPAATGGTTYPASSTTTVVSGTSGALTVRRAAQSTTAVTSDTSATVTARHAASSTTAVVSGVSMTVTGGSSGPVMQPLRVVPLGRPLPTLQILATSPTGRWVWLSQIGRVTGLSYSWSYPGGPMAADWSLDVPPSAQIPALVQGSTVQIWRGTVLAWAGRVATLERGAPWRITADGIGSAAVHEPVPTTGSLDSIVDAAITAGLPWTRPASLSTKSWTGSAGAEATATTMLDQALTDVLLQEGERWTVTPGGVVTAVVDPTTPTLLVRADTAPPMTLAKYASEVRITYQSSSGTFATRRVVNAAAAARFGRIAATLDLRYSVMTSTQADAIGTAWLARHAPSMTLSGDLTVTRGQVTTGTGGAVDLPLVRPGVMARIAVLPLIRDAMLVPSAAIDLIIGQTTYHADDGTLAISAVDRAPSPGEVILGAAA